MHCKNDLLVFENFVIKIFDSLSKYSLWKYLLWKYSSSKYLSSKYSSSKYSNLKYFDSKVFKMSVECRFDFDLKRMVLMESGFDAYCNQRF